MSAPLLELRGVRKSYQTAKGPHQVLDGIDFTVRRGERLGICGLNGAGKSTLINIISGGLSPDSGTIRRNCRMSWPLGYSGGLHGAMSGLANARFIARIYGADPENVAAFTEDFAELGKFFELPIRTYSAGMRSRLAFAVSMAIDFDMYLIDEILSAGDLRFHEKCHRAVEERREHASFLIVSHSLSTIEENCNRFALLHGGRLAIHESLTAAQQAFSDVFVSAPVRPAEQWRPNITGPLSCRAAEEDSGSVDMEITAAGPGHVIFYWGNGTDGAAFPGDKIQFESPVQLLSDPALLVPRWTGLQFVERDLAGSALTSDVAPQDLAAPAWAMTRVVENAGARHLQFGLRVEMAGPGMVRLRLGRAQLRRDGGMLH